MMFNAIMTIIAVVMAVICLLYCICDYLEQRHINDLCRHCKHCRMVNRIYPWSWEHRYTTDLCCPKEHKAHDRAPVECDSFMPKEDR